MLGKATYLDCVRGGLGKRLLTGCLLQGPQQFTGLNFIFYYGTQYFQNSGIKNPFVDSMITSAVNTPSTLPGLWAIDKEDLYYSGEVSYHMRLEICTHLSHELSAVGMATP